MNFRHRKTLFQIGDGLEIAGNITLAAAAIFGILSTFIVLSEVANKSKESDRSERSQGDTHINFISIDPYPSYYFGCYHHQRRYDNTRFYRDLLVSSAICSIIGTALAISFQIHWVAITVVSLWVAAAALSFMGRALINYALTLQEPDLEPSAPPFIPEKHATASLHEPSAPPLMKEDACYYQPTVAHWAGYATIAR